jgi:hypothetical protein
MRAAHVWRAFAPEAWLISSSFAAGVLCLIIVLTRPPVVALFERLPCEYLSSHAGHPGVLPGLVCSIGAYGPRLLYNEDLYEPWPERRTAPKTGSARRTQATQPLQRSANGRRQTLGMLSVAPQVRSLKSGQLGA